MKKLIVVVLLLTGCGRSVEVPAVAVVSPIVPALTPAQLAAQQVVDELAQKEARQKMTESARSLSPVDRAIRYRAIREMLEEQRNGTAANAMTPFEIRLASEEIGVLEVAENEYRTRLKRDAEFQAESDFHDAEYQKLLKQNADSKVAFKKKQAQDEATFQEDNRKSAIREEQSNKDTQRKLDEIFKKKR